MPPAGGGQQGEADNSLAALWIIIGIFALLAFIWHFFSAQIVEAIFVLRRFEAEFLRFFLPTSWATELNKVVVFTQAAKASGYASVDFPQLIAVSDAVGRYIRYPGAVILLAFAGLLLQANPISKYRKTYDMKKLLNSQVPLWPQISAVAKLDLVNQDLDKGPWAMAMAPMDFAKKNNILIVEQTQRGESRLASKSILTAAINPDEARKVFALQVGAYWQGPEKLPIHIRALFAIFACRIAGDRESATNLIRQISASADKAKLDFANVDQLIKKYRDNKLVQATCHKHAFVLTVMAAMLELSRSDGVQAVADFLWLKPIDRRLWFMLGSIGRQTAFVEVAGPFAHWLAEKEIGHKLNVPMIEEAVIGITAAVKELIYKPDEPAA